MEERNLCNKVLNERNKMQYNVHSGKWEYKIRGPPWNQKLSRSEVEHNKKLSEFDSILYKCRQFNKQKKRTLSFNRVSNTGNHMHNRNSSPERVTTFPRMRHYLLIIASFKFKVLIVLRTTTNHCVI